MTQEADRPRQSGFSHLGLSVTDLDTTISWYCDVLGAVVTRGPFPGDRAPFSGQTANLLVGPLILDLYHHAANGGERFEPTRTGLDHFALRADSYADLEQWARWLDTKGVERSEIRETGGVGWMFDFVDPDGLQVEFLVLDKAKVSAMYTGGSVRADP